MSVLKQNEGRKWIQGLLAVTGVVAAFITLAFLRQLSEWFDLEAKLSHFNALSQAISILVGFFTFLLIWRNKTAYQYLDEVYSELVKVIWPDRESTLKLTVGIIVGVIITSIVLGLVDFGISKVFGLLYT